MAVSCNPIFRELANSDSLWPNPAPGPSKWPASTMTPTPPSNSPDGGKPLPPRHRPTLGDLNKDTTELDLWAFDEDLEDHEISPVDSPRSPSAELPAPRERRVARKDKAKDSGAEEGGAVSMNVGKELPRVQKSSHTAATGAGMSGFDDLEDWDDASHAAELGELPETPQLAAQPAVEQPVQPEPEVVESSAQPAAAPSMETPVEAPVAADDEFSPAKRPELQPANLRPHLRLSGLERIGMLALFAILIVGGGLVYVYSLLRLPTESTRAATHDFPITGEKVVIDAADTYWREPVTEGPDADTFRRGTRLLPVIELRIAGGSGAVRVLFRNEDRLVIGDAVTRTVDGATTLRIAATAGFDDLGMHAAYRTGGSKPWTAEVFEAASVNSPGREFKRLFEMDISTARR